MLGRQSMVAKSFVGINVEPDDETSVPSVNSSSILRKFGAMPVPTNFVDFLPWVANEMDLEESVKVKRVTVEDYVPAASIRRKAQPTKKKMSMLALGPTSQVDTRSRLSSVSMIPSYDDLTGRVVPITAYYDPRDHLIELSIAGNKHLSQKLMKLINLVIPFHPEFKKLTVKGSVKQEIVYEIGELLPLSNVTEVCLDQTHVKQGNYYALLDYSRLKRLSLNRCSINDVIVEEITSRLERDSRVSRTLQILELSSNFITDTGAYYLAKLLRRNRHLVHLNLAGNRLTNQGAFFILDTLQEFQLTKDENVDRFRRKSYYWQKRIEIFKRCLAEQTRMQGKRQEPPSWTSTLTTNKKKSMAPTTTSKFRPKILQPVDLKNFAEAQTDQIMGGPFKDPFDDAHVVFKDRAYYCTGNFKLCSLNFAYNALDYFSLKRLVALLSYQQSMSTPTEPGLLRLILDGNYLPESCAELELINGFLKDAVYIAAPEKPTRKKASDFGINFRQSFAVNTI